MKNYLFILLLSLTGLTSAFAQQSVHEKYLTAGEDSPSLFSGKPDGNVVPVFSLRQGAVALAGNATYDFGNVNTGNTATLTFTIENTGADPLTLTGTPKIQLNAGSNAAYTTDETGTLATVAPGATTTFTISFAPVTAGTKTGQITIANDDATQDPFVLNLTGIGVVTAPVMTITQGATTLSDNDTYNFGSINTGSSSATITFTIANTGNASLNLTSTPKIAISGTNAADFTVVQTTTTTPVLPAGTTTFTITFSPSSFGTKTALIAIANNSGVSPYRINLTGTGVLLASVMDIKQGVTAIADNATYDFGTADAGGGSGAVTFTIENTGNSVLTLSGNPKIAISGTNAADFTINQTSTAGAVLAGLSTTFTISFNPAAAGNKTAQISITNNSATNPYIVNLTGTAVAPVMGIKQGVTAIADNGNFSFGNTNTGSSSTTITFTIENTGNANLNLSGTPKIAISGANASEFTIVQTATTTPVAAAGSTTFTVTFSPTTAGAKTAQISIANNSATNPYRINLSGTGTTPITGIKQGATAIANNGTFNFGNFNTGVSSGAVTFTIENTGTADLLLSGVPKITVSGANAADFTINQATTNSPVAAGSTTNFSITFIPSATGVRTAQISIQNNSAVSPYTFTINGTGTAPIMGIKQGATAIADNGVYNFGNVNTGTNSNTITFTIENSGTGSLVLSGTPVIAISGANAADFTINQASTTTPVAAGNTTTFTITFSSATTGAKTALISIANNSATSPYRINLTGTGTTPVVNIKQAATSIADNGNYSFGNVNVGSNSGATTFTIENTGTGTLTLSGVPKIAISGANAADFTINQTTTAGTVAAAGNTTFTITFTPSAGGNKTAQISVNNNSATNPYTINLSGTGVILAPVAVVKQGATTIADNGTYAFGNQDINTSSGVITFTIENTGNANLNLSGTPKIAISGANASEFTIVQTATTTPIAAAGSTTFTVTFSPTTAGAKTAQISIANNSATNPYRINLSGTGIFNPPVIGLKQGATALANNATFNFGNVNAGENSTVTTFTIENTGGNPLNLTGTPKITISGTNAGEFTVNQTTTTATVAAGGNTTFTVTFSPLSGGAKTAQLSIANNDATNNPYKINLTGTGVPPVMTVAQDATTLPDNGNFSFGNIDAGTSSNTFTFTIENTGAGILSLSGNPKIAISGANAADFTINQTTTAGTVAAAGNTTFTVTFSPAAGGGKTALLSIANNSGTSPYRINLSGNAVTPVMGIKQGATTIADNGNFSVGTVNVGANSLTFTFTIENTGAGNLNLTGNPVVAILGTNAGEFTINQALTATPVNAGGSTTFTVRMNPVSAGNKTALLSISNNSGINPYRVNLSGTAIAPVMNVKQGATAIASNGNFNFGNVNAGASSNTLTFTVENTGTASLSLSGNPKIGISGTNAADFTINQVATSATIAAGATTTFTITFSPATAGNKTAQLTISNNSATDPYTVNLTGTGTTPLIGIRQGATAVANDGTYAFGSFNTGTSSNTITFIIENTGTGVLNLTGTPLISISGTNSSEFTLNQVATANSLAPNGNTTFTITFSPTSTGNKTAQIAILTNDAARNPYRINLTGTGTTPIVNLKQGVSSITDNGIYSFGNVNTGTSSSTITFTIENTGTGLLTLSGNPVIAISGANAGEFTVNQVATSATIAAGGSTTFTVTFSPATAGNKTALISIANNSGTNPYRLNLTGTAVFPVMGIRQNATILANNSTFSFGNVDVSSSSGDFIFTIENTGNGTLNLNGNPVIALVGGDFDQYRLETINTATSVSPNGSTIFKLAFQPTTAGDKSIVGEIYNNDATRNPYRITFTGKALPLIPVLSLQQGADTYPSNSIFDFGSVNIGSSSSVVTFTIKNTGNTNLNLTGTPKIAISGTNAADFTINQTTTTSPIGAGSTTTFTIAFSPSATGSRSAQISLAYNSLSAPYKLNISGTGFLNPPVMGIKQGSTAIANNGSFSFGIVNAGTSSSATTFTIENTGQSTLNLTGNPKITLSGTNATDFVINQTSTLATITQNGSTTFTVSFAPASGGSKSAVLSIANNDGSRNPYIINLTGTANPSVMAVKQGSTAITSGGSYSFGNTTINTSSGATTFTIENSGAGLLTLSGNPKIAISGTDANLFSVSQSSTSATVSQNGNTTFTITFLPTTTGNKTAQISITNNSGTNPYIFTITGSGVILPPDIFLKQNTTVLNQNATYDWGNVNVNTTNTVTFTIENSGTGTLILSNNPKISLSGSSEFTVNQTLTVSPLAPGGSTTFTVTFTPNSEGVKTAQISIASNDPAKNPYTLSLTGTGQKVNQTINFTDIPGKLVTDAPFGITATASSNLPVAFSVVSGPVSVSGNTITILGTGTVTIRASQSGNVQYNAATSVEKSFVISKVPQIITFQTIPDKLTTDPPFDLIASVPSGLPVTFTIVSGPATLAGNRITLTGSGTITVKASQSGNNTYAAAPDVEKTFVVSKAGQTINFTDIPDKLWDAPPFAISAIAGSNLAVTFTVTKGDSIVSVTGTTTGTVTLKGKYGTVTIKASQGGNNLYNAAPDVEKTFQVLPAITLTNAPKSTAPPLAGATLPTEIKVNQYQPSNISKAELFYRGTTRATWKKAAMTTTTPGIFTGNLPVSDADEIGLEYYFTVEPITGPKVSSDTVAMTIKYPAPGLALTGLLPGASIVSYSLITIPLNLTDNKVTAILEELGSYNIKKWRLFRLRDTQYQEFNTNGFDKLVPGESYMLIVKEQTTINVGEGSTLPVRQTKPFTIALKKGFNLIGNPYNLTLSWDDILKANKNPADLGSLIIFDRGVFRGSTSIDKFRGALLYAEKDLTLTIPVLRNTSLNPGKIQKTNDKDWVFVADFTLSDGEMKNEIAGLGMHRKAIDTKDTYDEIGLPRGGFGFVDMRFAHPEHFMGSFAKDIVGEKQNYTWHFTVESSLGKPVSLVWDLYFADKKTDKRLVLLDMDNNKLIETSLSQSYTFASGIRHFRAFYGNEAFLKEAIQPSVSQLGEVYPNPFAEETKIELLIADENTQAEISIFDSKGRNVRNMTHLVLKPGFREIYWNGKDDNGNHLPAGLYIIKARIANQTGIQDFYKKVIFAR